MTTVLTLGHKKQVGGVWNRALEMPLEDSLEKTRGKPKFSVKKSPRTTNA